MHRERRKNVDIESDMRTNPVINTTNTLNHIPLFLLFHSLVSPIPHPRS
jgi:hypothetical protein